MARSGRDGGRFRLKDVEDVSFAQARSPNVTVFIRKLWYFSSINQRPSMVDPQNKITGMTNNSEEQQTSSSTEETIIEVSIQPPTTEAKVESDAPPTVITTQPAQPMPEHDDSIAVVMWEATVTGRRLIDEMVNLGSFYVAQEEKAEGHDFNEYVMPHGKLPLNALERYRLLDDVNKILLGCVNGWVTSVNKMNIAWSLKLWLITTLESTHLWRALFNVLNQALHKILRKVHGGRINTGVLKENLISCDHLLEQVKKIKEELIKEAQWRPVFADIFRQGIKPRRRAGFLRHMLVESGITYAGLTETFKVNLTRKMTVWSRSSKRTSKGKNEADVEEVIKLLNQHLAQPDKPVRRGSGRRVPRTRSLCTATDLEKQQPASKIEPEENNNDPVKVIMDVIPSTPAVLSEV
ncbi:hypothetical protein DAPPUDRAFT_106800 [Daphnia pulex]|uniref:Exuperantia SAM-like domain-containing protein n=1 Tax=Daphnia pulex TaxID=6669 RepID=E9GUY9_DAPPU|nr:hypothetical protein DAPPUDRAFT_106800 [Daphnia pulex]|eukprot:EFX76572.1 hypothetical protein DAPPUDRAFT_106800 [Daphnia pulex]